MADPSQYWQQQQGGWTPQQPPTGVQPPGGPQGPQTPGGEATMPPKPDPTPLDPPVVYYSTTWRVAPLVVDTQEQADALDPNEWTTGAPPTAKGGPAEKVQWPQLYYNVNVAPKIVNDAQEARSLGGEWQAFNLPDSLCKAAEANNKLAKAKADAAAQKQQQKQPAA